MSRFSKLSDQDIDDIREAYRYGSTDANCLSLSKKYNINKGTVWDIVNYKGSYICRGINTKKQNKRFE